MSNVPKNEHRRSDDLSDKMSGLHVHTDTDDDDIKGVETFSTTATESTTPTVSPFTTPFPTPAAATQRDDNSFQTPQDHSSRRRTDWSNVCLSPTNLLPYDVAISRLKADGIDKQHFYRDGSPRLKACIQYVYGLNKDEYTKLSTLDRVNKMYDLVKTTKELERLASIVFSHPKDMLMLAPGQREAYVQMALTSYLFTNHKIITASGCTPRPVHKRVTLGGGFPGKAALLNQNSRNCFHPSSVLFVSLVIQFYNILNGCVDSETFLQSTIMDSAQVARRYLVTHEGALEKRVINNRGHSARDFVTDVIVKQPHLLTRVPRNEKNEITTEKFCINLIANLDQFGAGLITQFIVTPHFNAAGKKNPEYQAAGELGYFLFDGDTIDTEGTYISYAEHKEGLKPLETEIQKELNAQHSLGVKRLAELKEKLQSELVDDNDNDPTTSNMFDGNTGSSSSGPSQSSGTHAMTLLAYEHHPRDDKTIFLACNPWQELPLVGFSAGYLRACQAKVYFFSSAPSPDENIRWNETLVADCSSYEVEGGDETCPEAYIRDAFGLSEPDMTIKPGFFFGELE